MGPAAPLEQFATRVCDLTQRLGQQQALRRLNQVDSPAGLLVSDPLVIQLRRIATQRKPKAILAGDLAVTGTLITPEPRQNWLNVIQKRRGLISLRFACNLNNQQVMPDFPESNGATAWSTLRFVECDELNQKSLTPTFIPVDGAFFLPQNDTSSASVQRNSCIEPRKNREFQIDRAWPT